MNTTYTESAAHRAAGQAIAAMLNGAPLQRIGVAGVEMSWDDDADHVHSRADLLADIAIGLTGVAAQSAFHFGWLPREYPPRLTFHCFDEQQVADLTEVMKLVEIIDPEASQDIYFQAFRQAFDLIAEPLVWAAVKALTAAIQEREVSVRELAAFLVDPDRCGSLIPLPPNHEKGSFDVD